MTSALVFEAACQGSNQLLGSEIALANSSKVDPQSISSMSPPASRIAPARSMTFSLASAAFSADPWRTETRIPIPAAAAMPATAPAGPKPESALASVSWIASATSSKSPENDAAASLDVDLASSLNSSAAPSAFLNPRLTLSPTSSPAFFASPWTPSKASRNRFSSFLVASPASSVPSSMPSAMPFPAFSPALSASRARSSRESATSSSACPMSLVPRRNLETSETKSMLMPRPAMCPYLPSAASW